MSLLIDNEIQEYVERMGMISPFESKTISLPKHLSYGLSSSSYEVRVEPIFKLFLPETDSIIDPVDFKSCHYEEIHSEDLVMPAHSFALCMTLEVFSIPDDISILCVGKSTYARCGIIVNPTMVNPGTRGKIILELSNTAPRPVIVRGGNNGVAKFMFFKSNNCSNPYNGAYQDQNDIRLPRSRV